MKLFVGFDLQNHNIKILNAEKAADTAATEYLHFSSRVFTDEFFDEMQKLLENYFSERPSLRNLPVYVVLPDEAVGFETFNLPNMPRVKLIQALEAETNNLYEGRQKNFKINRFQLAQNKQYSTFGAVYFDKKLVARIYRTLSDVKLFPKDTTYSGNALLNSAFNFSSRLRGKSFVFADMHLDYTEIAVSSKGRTLGTAVIPHGLALLKTDKIEQEYMNTDHSVGELAVINAREAARAKALTLSDGDAPNLVNEDSTIEDFAVEDRLAGEAAGAAADAESATADGAAGAAADAESATAGGQPREAAALTAEAKLTVKPEPEGTESAAADGAESATDAEPAAADGAESATADGFSGDDEKGDDGLLTAEDVEQPKVAVKKIKVYRKMPRRYPKFMMREIPDTEEGFMYENFRTIMKWILLYARQAALSEYTASPDFIVVNMPRDKYFLLDRANEEQGDGIKFRPFSAADKLSDEIRNNLALYGCMFARHFNKNHNF